MEILSWQGLALAAGLTIPPLVALYFLKLKRQERLVPSTLLWRRAVEDLRVNSPFQRLRRNLLLLLQLLVLLAGALALGKPMLQVVERAEDTVVILVDQSASMGVREVDGKTRLERAQEQAKLCVDGMAVGARAMVIAFCDRATVVSSFDTDKAALKRKIDSIEPTQSTSTLGEALSLAEAYTQNIIIGGEQEGSDIPPESPAAPATVYMFTDGRITDARDVKLEKFDAARMVLTNVAERADNVGIVSMQARRNYEQPDALEVAFVIRNFGPQPVRCEASVWIDGQNRAVVPVELDAAPPTEEATAAGDAAPTSVASAAGMSQRGFAVQDTFAGSGVVEVQLWSDDALEVDDRAWTIVPPPRHLRVLLVTDGNLFLTKALEVLPITFDTLTPAQYEAAPRASLTDGLRSAYDVVILDGHSTARLPQGNYLFWGAVPKLEGLATGRRIDDEVLFNWDDTHPVLRHVGVEAISIYEWLELRLPPEAVVLIEGQTSPVLAYLTRDASQYLIASFRLLATDEAGNPTMNTFWVTQVDFVVFMQNALEFLASNLAVAGRRAIAPGEPITLPVPERVTTVTIQRPDGLNDTVLVAGYQTVHYARTRAVGVYQADPGVPGDNVFAVNLFDPVESNIAPAHTLVLGGTQVTAQPSELQVSKPAWPYVLIVLLVILLVEWIIYNQRVFV
ncbi:MAG TPA: BatA and WFA domain-containing protein [Phycisphaerae bacterium]|nr:BatA and WFA domain-containing protein [Phycisphaerae bacterium]HNU46866.1 BatA and WFA domain-containing protein [Phycisphaerae bacterium]